MASVLLPLLLLLLLPPSPALGNEGAAAGSCKCKREAHQPQIVRDFPHRLQSCQTCPGGHMIRFTFPSRKVCGWKTDAWALSFWNDSCTKNPVRLPEEEGGREAMRADAHRPPPLPTPAPCSTVPTEGSPGPVQSTPQETPRAQLAPGRTTDAYWGPGRARSTPQATGDPAGAGPSRLSLREEARPPPAAEGTRSAVMSLVGVALVGVALAVAVLVVCQRRRRCQGGALAGRCPSGHPGEEIRCLPGEET